MSSQEGMSASALLTIHIEELSTSLLDYYFAPGLVDSSDEQLVLTLASQLRTNASLTLAVVSEHLPSFGIQPTSVRSLTVNQTSVSIYSSSPVVYMIHIQISVTAGTIPSLPSTQMQSTSGGGRRRLMDAVAGACTPQSTNASSSGSNGNITNVIANLTQGLSPIIVGVGLPGTADTSCITAPITTDSIAVSQMLTFFLGASQSQSDSTTSLDQAGTSVQALSDVFDDKDSANLGGVTALFDESSSAQSTQLANLAVSESLWLRSCLGCSDPSSYPIVTQELSFLLQSQSGYTSIVSSAIEVVLAALTASASPPPLSVSAASALEGYGISLGDP